MQIVEWRDKNSWDKFIAGNSNPASFLQAWPWGELQKFQGHETTRLGIIPDKANQRDTENLLAIAQLTSKNIGLGKKLWYLPRGPVIRQDNLGSQEIIIQALVDYLKTDLKILLRVTPGWSKTQDKTHWQKLNFSKPDIFQNIHEPETTWLTKLEAPDEMLVKMHQKTRYNIRLAERKSVVSYQLEVNSEKFNTFYTLLKETANRQKIKVFPKEHYSKILNLDSDKFQVKIFNANFENKILATALVVGFGNTLTYLHGGSSQEHKDVMAPHALHWHIMNWGLGEGYDKYDWWGIEPSATIDNKQLAVDENSQRSKVKGHLSSLAGVTRFKKGFGGQELKFAGTHDHILNKKTFNYLKILKKIKQIF